MVTNRLLETPVVGYSEVNDRLERARLQYDDDEQTPYNLHNELLDKSSDAYDEDESVPAKPLVNPDRLGIVRIVKDAHLVFKRKDEHNKYVELWVFKENKISKTAGRIYNAILAGTDIPVGSIQSQDGLQTVIKWEVGPADNTLIYVEIKGMQN